MPRILATVIAFTGLAGIAAISGPVVAPPPQRVAMVAVALPIPTTTTAPPDTTTTIEVTTTVAPPDTTRATTTTTTLAVPDPPAANHEDVSPPAGTHQGDQGGHQGYAGTEVAGCIRAYESGGTTNTEGDYTSPGGGAYQFEGGTWGGYGGYGEAQDAPVSVQDARFNEVWPARGHVAWAAQAGRCF